ncbi:MAG: hypothetical protein AB7S26_40540 [Sandaracinaceae bacterium]
MRLTAFRTFFISIAPLMLVLSACAVEGVTAVNPLTGEEREFASDADVPTGWIVCASAETCPPPRDCEVLDEVSCLSRPDCSAVYVGIGAYPRECEGPEPPALCDGSGYAGCTDAAVTCDAAACGPMPLGATFLCPDGSTGGVTGRCVSQDDGSCGWEWRDCPPPTPAECPVADCGPALGLPAYECDDGSIGGNTGRCLRLSDGSCGWEVRDCPSGGACSADECGPAPLSPAYMCPDGSWGGNIGVCERNADGACGWIFRDCPTDPPPCSLDDCGPAPGAPNYECADGSIGGPVCDRSAAGVCGWFFRECPTDPPACPADCGTYCEQASSCTLPDGCGNPGCGCPVRVCP